MDNLERFYSKRQIEVQNTIANVFIISAIVSFIIGILIGMKLSYSEYNRLKEEGLKLEYLYYDKDHNLKWKENK